MTNLKQSLITEAQEKFKGKYSDLKWVDLPLHQDVIECINKDISDIVAHTVDKTVQEVKHQIVSEFGEWYDPVIGSQLVPFLDSLTNKKGEDNV